ncbi:MAG: hypothetical protein ACOYEG_08355 [Petrimonas sp.]|jgi:hypothetical protein
MKIIKMWAKLSEATNARKTPLIHTSETLSSAWVTQQNPSNINIKDENIDKKSSLGNLNLRQDDINPSTPNFVILQGI